MKEAEQDDIHIWVKNSKGSTVPFRKVEADKILRDINARKKLDPVRIMEIEVANQVQVRFGHQYLYIKKEKFDSQYAEWPVEKKRSYLLRITQEEAIAQEESFLNQVLEREKDGLCELLRENLNSIFYRHSRKAFLSEVKYFLEKYLEELGSEKIEIIENWLKLEILKIQVSEEQYSKAKRQIRYIKKHNLNDFSLIQGKMDSIINPYERLSFIKKVLKIHMKVFKLGGGCYNMTSKDYYDNGIIKKLVIEKAALKGLVERYFDVQKNIDKKEVENLFGNEVQLDAIFVKKELLGVFLEVLKRVQIIDEKGTWLLGIRQKTVLVGIVKAFKEKHYLNKMSYKNIVLILAAHFKVSIRDRSVSITTYVSEYYYKKILSLIPDLS